MLALVALGAMRELLGAGTLLADADLLFGPVATHWTLTIIPDFRGFLLAILPPGAFIGLALLIAAKNGWERRRARPATRSQPAVAAPDAA